MSNILRQNAIRVYNTLYGGAVDLAVQFGVVSSKPRTADRQWNRANPQVADTKDYQFPDHLLNKLRNRFGEKRSSISGRVIEYKVSLNRAFTEYQQKAAEELRNVSKKDTKELWKILNKFNNKKIRKIKMISHYKHCLNILRN